MSESKVSENVADREKNDIAGIQNEQGFQELRIQSTSANIGHTNTGHKAVHIFPHHTNRYSIDKTAFERIFQHPGVVDTPVAIYSLGGPFRTGKSFMLNLMMRFLWAQNKTSASWLQQQQIDLRGFGWRGGMRHHTHGIWIWDEPFFVKTRQHERVALFLMDTQGWFDSSSSVEDNSVIFALSTLISSKLICNVQNTIKEDTLQHLHLFTEYLRVAQKILKQDDRSLQDIMFLVRDWLFPDVPFGFDGGNELLDRVFQVQYDHKDIKSVRNNLRDSFKNVSCFLMPHPGEKLGRMYENQSQLDVAGVRTCFKQMVDVLVRRLFHPDNLVVKEVNNKPVTGKDLINFTFEYVDLFCSGKMPKVGTVMETTAIAAILEINQKCRDIYRRHMNQACENKYKTDKEILDINEVCKKKTLVNFDQMPKFGNDLFVEKHRKNLEDIINHEFEEYKKINMATKEQVKLKVRESIFAAERSYKQNLGELGDGQYFEENDLHEIEEGYRKTAVDLYLQQTNQHPQEIAEKYKEKLESRLDAVLKQFTENNLHKREELRGQLEEKKMRAVLQYRCSMEEICGTGYTDAEVIKSAHFKAKEQAETFVLSVDHSNGSDLVGKYISQLDEFLSNELKIYQRRNENLKIHFSSKLAKIDAVSLSTSTNIVDYIGCGGFGAIRRCFHESLGTVVAKCISLTGEVNQIYSHKKSVQGEAETLVRVQHPNIVQIYGFTSWNNEIAIILEFIGGENLSRYLEKHREKKVSWMLRLRFARQLISALTYLHNYNPGQIFCHGDIKPDNILLTTRLCLKLSDFGANNVIRASGMKPSTVDTTITRQYSLLYVSPEFYKGGSVDPASDIYSFGMVLYEIVTLNPIFYGRTLSEEILMARISSGVRPDETYVENVETTLADDDKEIFNILTNLMRKCWDGDASVRPKAEQIFKDLSRVSTTDHDEINVTDDVLEVQPQPSSKMGNLSQFTAPFMVATLTGSFQQS